MKILVCIKQVPASNQISVDPVTGVLLRSGVESKMNPYDLYALETALRLREAHGGTVTALCMGPPQAQDILREAFSMGADDALLLSDRRFGGADVLATSYTLAQGARAAAGGGLPFDLILCGKQTTDGDTAQVGSELAEFLGLPSVANVTAVVDVAAAHITVDMDLPGAVQRVTVRLPAVLSVDQGIYTPRLPSYVKRQETRGREIRVLTLADMEDTDESHYGLGGSPTQVRRIFPPEARSGQEYWRGPAEETCAALVQALRTLKFI